MCYILPSDNEEVNFEGLKVHTKKLCCKAQL